MTSNTTPEEYYNDYWKGILEKPDGSIDIEQLKKELYDYSEMEAKFSSLICYCTNGKLSKTNYTFDVYQLATDEAYENNSKD